MPPLLGDPRIKTKDLAELSRRLSTSLGAGVDIRRVFARESDASRGPAHVMYERISQAVSRGSSLNDALAQTGAYFPRLFREMVHVGEQSGKLPDVFRQLAEHYDHQVQLRRVFVGAIWWPLFQLAAAIAVVGFLIWFMGMISPKAGEPIDLLGFGLVGNSGLVKYLAFVSVIAIAFALLVRGLRRGLIWARPIQLFLLRVPRLGRALETLALSRLAWSLHVTLDSGMDLRKALSLSLSSTNNVHYTSQIEPVTRTIAAGNEIHEAFERTGAYPVDFLDAVEVGEESGRLVESLGGLSRRYQDEARSALAMLATFAGFLVWAFVAVLIIFLIFRLASFYTGTINELAKPHGGRW